MLWKKIRNIHDEYNFEAYTSVPKFSMHNHNSTPGTEKYK